MVAAMRRVRFFRDAELKGEALHRIADWFEVQSYDAFEQVVREGHWCSALYYVYSGIVEAMGAESRSRSR